MSASPRTVEVLIEISKGSFVKRRAMGDVAFVSPVPCPFNYGSVPDSLAPDGDPLDVVVLGPRLPRGTTRHCRVRATVLFTDAGVQDDKLICSEAPIDPSTLASVERFFRLYALCKRVLNAVQRRGSPTYVRGVRDHSN